jgi:phosphoribosylformylglycinamidine synthase II
MNKITFKDIDSTAKAFDLGLGQDEIKALLKRHKITDDEYQKLETSIGRKPTMAELGVFSAMWSEHCSYKSSRVHLRRFPTTGKHVVVGPGENAGVVRLEGDVCLAFKMESHNHPSFIEPYQGAATGVGGILRDVFCMGARPIANLNCLRFGKRTAERMRFLFENVVKGIGDYGNCIGVPTVGGNVSFDERYNGNILVNAMTVGMIRENEIFKGYASGVGNYLVYAGSATGRDGVHGATMASDSFSSSSTGSKTTIQVGDPFAEKLLLEATLELLRKDLVIGLQDMGAAGLTSSSFEMAARAESGLYVELDRIPVRAKGLNAYEMLLSESQERMLLVVTPEKWPEAQAVLSHWEIDFAVIGEVTEGNRVKIAHKGVLEVDLPVSPIVDSAPKYERPMAALRKVPAQKSSLEKAGTIEKTLTTLLADNGSMKWITDQFDQDIGIRTVLSSRQGGAAVLKADGEWLGDSKVGVVVSTACDELKCNIDPFKGSEHSVLKCARMISAAGGEPLGVTDCLNFGNPMNPEVMREISDSIDGIAQACRKLEVPVVSGNVSLYNETDGVSIRPTPMIGMVGKIADYSQRKPAIVSQSKGQIYMLSPAKGAAKLGCAAYGKFFTTTDAPTLGEIDYAQEIESMECVRSLSKAKGVQAIRDVGRGGVLVTLAKMLAATSSAADIEGLSSHEALFGENQGTYVIVADGELPKEVLANLRHSKVDTIGQIIDRKTWRVGAEEFSLNSIYHAFNTSLDFA